MIVGLGIDIVEVARIGSALENSEPMIRRVFTEAEIQYCLDRKNKYQHFAARFAAKEAALKALGTGWQAGIRWRDVEISVGNSGKPELAFYGKAKEFFSNCGATSVLLSLTHTQSYAVAVVILES